MTNRELEGNQVFGELNCPDAVETDQGAYSCEAISNQGTCFAGSAGCGQPGQDAIVVIDDGTGGDSGKSPCAPGTFNALATVRY